MQLKFPVAAELIATSYSFPAGNSGGKILHMCVKNLKKNLKKVGGRCLLVPPSQLGCCCGHSKPWSHSCCTKTQLWQQPGPYPAPPSWLYGVWAAALGALAFLLMVGRCRDTTKHSPAASVVLGWFKDVPARTDIPGAVSSAGMYPSSQAPFGQELCSL